MALPSGLSRSDSTLWIGVPRTRAFGDRSRSSSREGGAGGGIHSGASWGPSRRPVGRSNQWTPEGPLHAKRRPSSEKRKVSGKGTEEAHGSFQFWLTVSAATFQNTSYQRGARRASSQQSSWWP